MTTSFQLEGKVAIVTGGNAGIGLGIATGLAQAGASLTIAGRRAEKNAEAVAELQRLGGRAIGVVTDVQDEASVQAMVQDTVDAFGRGGYFGEQRRHQYPQSAPRLYAWKSGSACCRPI